MRRRRERTGAQPAGPAVARKNVRVEALLQTQLPLHPDAAREVNELRAAGQEDVLPVIYFLAADFERRRASAQQPAALEHFDVGTLRFLQLERGGQTRETSADDRNARSGGAYALESHERTTTRSFSVFDSAARARSGSAGSRSIFLSSSS